MNIVVDLSGVDWRKSTYSGMQNDCVEVASVHGCIATRDSKEPDGPVLVFRAEAWTEFIQATALGEFPE